MYCNKAKKGKHCITYTLQLIESYKIKLDRSSSERRIFQSSVVNSAMFWLFRRLHECAFPRSELGYADWMTHCGMVPNGVADSIKFQLTSLRGIEVLACSFNTDFNYGLF